jgi:adenine phosphoribosyltransferase
MLFKLLTIAFFGALNFTNILAAELPKETYPVTVSGRTFNLPLKTVNGGVKIAYVDLKDPTFEPLRKALVDLMEKEIKGSFDVIMAPASKMNVSIKEFADRKKIESFVINKLPEGETLPEGSITVTYKPITRPTDQTLYLTKEEVKSLQGKRLLLVDDVASTGASLKAATDLLTKAGLSLATKPIVLFWEGDARTDCDALINEPLPVILPPKQ